MRLQDKAIIVTGSTTGVGRAIAEQCVAEGARVLIHGLEPDLGRDVLAKLGDRAALHIDDLADPAAPRRIVDAAVNAFGKLDGLVNNAACIARSNINSTTAELFDRIIAVNVRAPLLLIQAALPHLKQTRGCVLNIGSSNAYCGEENLLAYSISKGALMTLSRNLGDALHAGESSGGTDSAVRVNHFNLGWVLTDNEIQYKIADGLSPDWYTKLPHWRAPSGSIMAPADIARHAVHWLSDDARPISGAVIDLEQFPFLGRNLPKKL